MKIAWWRQVNKSCPDPDEFDGNYHIISPLAFFNLGLRYSTFFPDQDNHNVVSQFLNLLSTADRDRLKPAISRFQSRYQTQFDLIKRICWQHLNTQRKQFISSVFS